MHSTISTIAAIIKEDPKPLGATVPFGLRALVERCLRKDTERCFQSMADVKVELEVLIRERLIGEASRLRRFLQTGRGKLGTATLLV